VITLRRAKFSDSDELLRWRNDNATRAYSTSTREVARADHEKWLRDTLEREDRALLIGCDRSGSPVGMVRFDESENGSVVSINVAPERRGMGLGSALLKAALDWHDAHFSTSPVIAIVHRSNRPSLGMFRAQGFEETESSGEFATLIRAVYLVDN
jgi:RimJ/RimL family protein N-acetyltransferase